jgi:hypothetical protein
MITMRGNITPGQWIYPVAIFWPSKAKQMGRILKAQS